MKRRTLKDNCLRTKKPDGPDGIKMKIIWDLIPQTVSQFKGQKLKAEIQYITLLCGNWVLTVPGSNKLFLLTISADAALSEPFL